MTSTEQQIEHFIATLASLGGSAGNQRLLEALGWQDNIYQRVKQQLLDDGRIRSGRGRGGSVALIEDASSLPSSPKSEPLKPSNGNPKRPASKKSMTQHGATT